MTASVQLLDPIEFLQPNRRLLIDTNVFMDTDPQRAGGLKRLFERGQSAILTHGNPIVVPTKVVGELTKQSRLDPAAETEDRAEAIRKAGAALTFLESASKVGLIRKDLGDNSNPYADDLFLQLFERFAGTYEMCLLTDDTTIKLRIRLLAHRLSKRLVVGVLTNAGDLEVESDQALFERGRRKYARHVARIAAGTGNFKDESEVASLGPLLQEFQKAFGVTEPATRPRPRHAAPAPRVVVNDIGSAEGFLAAIERRVSEPKQLWRPAATAKTTGTPFSATTALRPRDVPLAFTSLPKEGDTVTWESATKGGSLVLGSLLGEGGEGSVYEGGRGSVIKIFDKDHITEHRLEKLKLMVGHGLQAKGMCIPSALVSNQHGEFVGYVMPKASGREARTIFNIRKLEKDFPSWKKSHLVDICISFLEHVQYLHSVNIILGDINPKNLMIDDQRNVFIIDADSWQIDGYPCPVGTPMYTSPAMLGKTYADDLRSMHDELFAVATMLFQIVMTGQFPYMRTGTDGDMVQLIKEGNFAFQYESRNNKDQPDGDWKFIWSHIHKPVKDLFWHTFHKEGKRYQNRPTAAEWLEAFKAYRAYLGNRRVNFDPMSNDVRPIRNKAFRPDTPIEDCKTCGRKHAIAGIWNDDDEQYFIPRQCNKCRETQSARPAGVRPSATRSGPPPTAACKDCGKNFARTSLTYGRCPSCTTKASSLDTGRLCVDCRQPFITFDHIGWFTSRLLDIPKSHSAIKQACPPGKPVAKSSITPAPRTTGQVGLWSRAKKWWTDN